MRCRRFIRSGQEYGINRRVRFHLRLFYRFFFVLLPTIFSLFSPKSNAVVDMNTFVTRVMRMLSEKTVFETRLSITDKNRVTMNDFLQGDRLPISPDVEKVCHGDSKWCVPRAPAFPSVQHEIAPLPKVLLSSTPSRVIKATAATQQEQFDIFCARVFEKSLGFYYVGKYMCARSVSIL